MPKKPVEILMRRLRSLVSSPDSNGQADQQLLERIVLQRDEAAFTILVERHGPMVLGIARRVLNDEHLAEDVLQAAFLVLARNAAAVRKRSSLASWLYGVAIRLSRKARAVEMRRSKGDTRPPPAPVASPLNDATWREVREILDDELQRLPKSYRLPLILCYLEGRTRDEAAAELGWTPSRLKGLLERGREQLRKRLIRRGLAPAAATAALLTESALAVPLPPLLAISTIQTAYPALAGGAMVAGSSTIAHLAEGGLGIMWWKKILVLVGLALGLAGAGVGSVLMAQRPAPNANAKAPEQKNQPPEKESPKTSDKDPDRQPLQQQSGLEAGNPRIDPNPGPLPRGAVAQIGTTQFRQPGNWAFFTADGKTVISVSRSNDDIRWLDSTTGRLVQQMELPHFYHDGADFSPESGLLALIGSKSNVNGRENEGFVALIDTATRKVIRTMTLPNSTTNGWYSVRFTKDGKHLISVIDQEARVWDTKSGAELMRHGSKMVSTSFLISPDGKTIYFGGGHLSAWKWETEKKPKNLLSPLREEIVPWGLKTVALTPDGKTICLGFDSYIQIWDLQNNRPIGIIDSPCAGPHPVVALSPDGKILAVRSDEGKGRENTSAVVVLWDLAARKKASRITVGKDYIEGFSWSSDGTRLVAANAQQVFVRDVKTGRPTGPEWVGHGGQIFAMCFSRDGTLYTASEDRTIRAWDSSGRPKLEMAHSYDVLGVAVSLDNSLVAGSARNEICLWDAKTGKLRFKLFGNVGRGDGGRLQFSQDSKHLTTWDDEYLRVWDTRNGKLLSEHPTWTKDDAPNPNDPKGEARAMKKLGTTVSLAPSGDVFAIQDRSEVRLIDTMSGKELKKLDLGSVFCSSFVFSPDGQRLATLSHPVNQQNEAPSADSISIWDLTKGKRIWDAKAEEYYPVEVVYSPDGSRVAVGSSTEKSCRVRIFNATNGKEQGQFELPHQGGCMAFDHAGKRLAVAFGDTTAMIYDLDKAIEIPPKK